MRRTDYNVNHSIMKMNWNFNGENSATTACVPLRPLRLTYGEPVQHSCKTVFYRDDTRSTSSARTSKINLENFSDRDNVTIQKQFDELTMELKISDFAESTTHERERSYRRAFENVKRALPGLKCARFSGQHYFYPKNATSEKLRDEMVLVQKALHSVTDGMRRLNVHVPNNEPLRYELYLVFDKKHINAQTLARYVNEVFGRSAHSSVQPVRELRSQTIQCKLNDIPCQLTFHIFTELQMLDDIQGFLVHDRMGGSEALSRMLALTLELKLANDSLKFPSSAFPLKLRNGY